MSPTSFAEPAACRGLARTGSALPGFKIGIAWQGNPKFRLDRLRSIPLAQFAPLARVPGVHLFSLQKGPGTRAARRAPSALPRDRPGQPAG